MRRLLEMELARKIADSDIAVASVQLGSSAAPELLIVPLTDAACSPAGCRPRLLRIVAGGHADLFDGLAFPRRTGPDRFLVRPARHGEYYDLVVDGRASSTMEMPTWRPRPLSRPGSTGAASQRPAWARGSSSRRRKPATGTRRPPRRPCANASFPASRNGKPRSKNPDLYARYLSGEATDAELYGPDAPFHAISDIGDEAMEGCFGTLGRNDPITPAVDDCPDGYRILNFDGWSITAQPWVTDNRHLRNPRHAVAYCGCLASGLLKLDFGQSALDELASFYREEISEADMQPASRHRSTSTTRSRRNASAASAGRD